MASEKKFFAPVLYPTDKSLNREWFIKYRKEDWVNGGFCYGKYKGALNLVPTVEERLALSAQYFEMIKEGQPLPDYQGIKAIPSANALVAKENTNIRVCCQRFLAIVKADDKKPATLAQYTSKIKVFEDWLYNNGKDKLALGGFTEEEAQDFMNYLKLEKKLANHSWNAYKNLLSRVWDLYKKKVTENPWEEIKRKKNNTVHLESYPEELREKIKGTLPAYNKQLWFIMQFVYYGAIRPQAELRKMKVGDINFKLGIATVREEISKTGERRDVNLYHKLVNQLKKEGYHLLPADYYLFSHKRLPGPTMVSKNTYARMWDSFRKSQGIESKYKLYGSKHTGGKELTKLNDPYITKEHFGHGDMKTTMAYIGNLKTDELNFLQKEYPEFGKKQKYAIHTKGPKGKRRG
jgi:hypothetical protein